MATPAVLAILLNRIPPQGLPRKIPLHFTTDKNCAVVEYGMKKRRPEASFLIYSVSYYALENIALNVSDLIHRYLFPVCQYQKPFVFVDAF